MHRCSPSPYEPQSSGGRRKKKNYFVSLMHIGLELDSKKKIVTVIVVYLTRFVLILRATLSSLFFSLDADRIVLR